jgi:hypothetical protein
VIVKYLVLPDFGQEAALRRACWSPLSFPPAAAATKYSGATTHFDGTKQAAYACHCNACLNFVLFCVEAFCRLMTPALFFLAVLGRKRLRIAMAPSRISSSSRGCELLLRAILREESAVVCCWNAGQGPHPAEVTWVGRSLLKALSGVKFQDERPKRGRRQGGAGLHLEPID